MKLILFFLALSFVCISCKKEVQGCTNEFATNFNKYADVNCCCILPKVEDLIKKIEGFHSVEEDCGTTGSFSYQIEIVQSPNNSQEIYVYNFGDFGSDFYLIGSWNGSDGFDFNWKVNNQGCIEEITGFLNFENNQLHKKYIYTSIGSCVSKTFQCEAFFSF